MVLTSNNDLEPERTIPYQIFHSLPKSCSLASSPTLLSKPLPLQSGPPSSPLFPAAHIDTAFNTRIFFVALHQIPAHTSTHLQAWQTTTSKRSGARVYSSSNNKAEVEEGKAAKARNRIREGKFICMEEAVRTTTNSDRTCV